MAKAKMECCGGKCCCQPSAAKRAAIAFPLGLGFGVLCAYLASRGNPSFAFDLKSPALWIIVANRFMIGFTIFFAGWMTKHPLLKFPTPPWLRGFCIGGIVSIPLALELLVNPIPDAMKYFWLTVLVGGFYGLVIDVIASRCGAQGKDLVA
ncbi:MAG: hypothetical protein PHO48_02935 [Candidatus Gracilibacteria bacterium]|nr:hypothetical protein [Candidatus Gracilibacteria bacterium]MDD5179053.1 hypothetical protein [Candidatus Gracilibacteria bacterium]